MFLSLRQTASCVALMACMPFGIEAAAVPRLEDRLKQELVIGPGQADAFDINLSSNEFCRLSIALRLPQVRIILERNGNEVLRKQRSQGSTQPETISMISDRAAAYRLVIRSRSPAPGRYAIQIVERRAANGGDRDRLEIEELLARGRELRADRTPRGVRSSMISFTRALEIAERLGDEQSILDVETEIAGTQVYFLSQYRESLPHLFRVLAIDECLPATLRRAKLFDHIANAYRLLTDSRRALRYAQASLELKATADPEELALTLRILGDIHEELADAAALPYYQRAMEAVEDRNAPELKRLIHHSTGVYFLRRGEFQEAAAHIKAALGVSRVQHDLRGELSETLVLSMLYDVGGEPQRALAYADAALRLSSRISDPFFGAVATARKANAHQNLNQLDRSNAENLFALKIFRRLGDRKKQIQTLVALADSYNRQHDLTNALKREEEALRLSRAVALDDLEAIVSMAVAETDVQRKDFPEALHYASAAVDIVRSRSYLDLLPSALFARARAEEAAGNLEAARHDAEESFVLTQKLRGNLPAADIRASFLASMWATYDTYIDLLMRLHHETLAFETSENARASSLIELLRKSRGTALSRIGELGRIRSLREKISAKAGAQLARGTDSTSPAAKTIARELEDLQAQYESALADVGRNDALLATLADEKPISLEQIQREVLDNSSVLLEYSLGTRRSFLWVVTPETISSYELPPRATIEKRVGTAIRDVSKPSGQTANLAAASRMLLGPARASLANKRLIIVPDGRLQYLPFAALPSSAAGRPLIADHEIVTLPSALTIAVLRRHPRTRSPTKSIAIFADPVFERSDARVKSGTAAVRTTAAETDVVRSAREAGLIGLPRLPFTRREARAVSALVARNSRKEALDFDANRAAVMDSDLASYRFVHFATHGLLNNFHPELSGIVLSMVDRRGRDQDGFLSTADIFNLSWNADLVVLSGCRTGLGREIRGEGIAGLTRAFMYAGVPRVVASLWNVNDAATAELMKRLYEGMLGPNRLTPPAALRNAQRSLQKDKRWSAPYYWAGFVMHGEWR